MNTVKRGLRGLRGQIATDVQPVERSTIGAAAAKREQEAKDAAEKEAARKREAQQKWKREVQILQQADAEAALARRQKEEDRRAVEATQRAAVRARASSMEVHDDGTVSAIPRQNIIPPSALEHMRAGAGTINTDLMRVGTLHFAGSVTGHLSANTNATSSNDARSFVTVDTTPQMWNGVPVTTHVAARLSAMHRTFEPYRSRHEGATASARPDVLRVSVSMDAFADSRVNTMEMVGQRMRAIEERTFPIVEDIHVITGEHQLDRERDIMRRQENFYCQVPKTSVIISGYGDPVDLIAESLQVRMQSLRDVAINTARRHAQTMEMISCDTIAYNGDERYVVIFGDERRPDRRGWISGRVIMLSAEADATNFIGAFNLSQSIDGCIAAAIRTLRDQQDTASER